MESKQTEVTWQISVTKDHFTSIGQASQEVCQAVPGVRGEVVGNEAGEAYHFAVRSAENDPKQIQEALTRAGIPASVKRVEA